MAMLSTRWSIQIPGTIDIEFKSSSLCLCVILSHGCAVDEWMRLLLPLAVEKGTCIITNMGASKKAA